MARAQRALSAMCSVLVASVVEALLGLIRKRLDNQVGDDALTQNEHQSEVPRRVDNSKNSASAH